MTDQPKTATIPMELLEAYVALHRAVEKHMDPRMYGTAPECFDFDYLDFASDQRDIARASLAVKKQLNNEQGDAS